MYGRIIKNELKPLKSHENNSKLTQIYEKIPSYAIFFGIFPPYAMFFM